MQITSEDLRVRQTSEDMRAEEQVQIEYNDNSNYDSTYLVKELQVVDATELDNSQA